MIEVSENTGFNKSSRKKSPVKFHNIEKKTKIDFGYPHSMIKSVGMPFK